MEQKNNNVAQEHHARAANTSDTPDGQQDVRQPTLHLCRSDGGITNTRLEPWFIDFHELCETLLRPPPVGEKDGTYFLRGPLREGCSTRADANIEHTELILLDADSTLDPDTDEINPGAPSPLAVHIALIELGISHLLYTTHSDGQPEKGRRYRVLIPATVASKDHLDACVKWLINALHTARCWLADVPENHRLSQPWFFPRVQDEHSEYLCYAHECDQVFDVQGAIEWHQAEGLFTAESLNAASQASKPRDPSSVFSKFNASHDIDWILATLEDNGYTRASGSQINGEPSYRLLSPVSTSGNAGIVVFKAQDGVWRVHSHHNSGDPLTKAVCEVSTCDAWDLFRIFAHGDDQQAAIEAFQAQQDPIPVIKIKAGALAANVDAAVRSLAALNPPVVYQRGQTLCRVAHMKQAQDIQGCNIPCGTAHILGLQRAGLMVELSISAQWLKYAVGLGEWVPADPCSKVTAGLLESAGKWGDIPALLGISEVPILREDGSLLNTPGYDRETGLYVEGNSPEMSLPDRPTRQDAQRAAGVLLEPFQEFSFVEGQLDRAVLLAYLITLAVRPQLTTAPLFCISSTTPGSGKGLLVEAANLLVRGRDAATMPPVQGNGSEDESRKRITALLREGIASINLDNWSRPIGGESLNALLTTTTWTDRMLGVSETVTLPSRITLAATGNNLTVRGDMVRRSVLIQLDPGVERPELRVFKEMDLPGRVLRERGALLTALFTILKAYQHAGFPGAQDQRLGRFEPWSSVVCGPIRWLGFPDPTQSQERLRDQDPETDQLDQLLSAWWDVMEHGWTTAGDLVKKAEETHNNNLLRDSRERLLSALIEVAPEGRDRVNSNRLGWYLRRFSGRISGGFKLEQKPRAGGRSKHAQQYRVLRDGVPEHLQ